MSDKINPCPFCGSTITYFKSSIPAVRCGDCVAEGPMDFEESEAITKWNDRPEVRKLRAQRDELLAAAQDARRTLSEAYEIDSDRRQSLRLLDAAIANATDEIAPADQ